MNKLQKQLEKLASEKQLLQRERTDLQRQCSEMLIAVDKLNKEKVIQMCCNLSATWSNPGVCLLLRFTRIAVLIALVHC